MAIFKCKMCGGALEISENQFVATCEYCGTKQTLPKLDNEKKIALFSRANNLRIKSEFDKAAGIYESIIAEFRDEAEAYWGLVLCKYGIEYVDDGKGSRVPTCHRTLPLSVMDDDDFQQACENADITAKTVYRDEAKAIDKIQKKILNIALNEDPYDIFICYKETDDVTGSRTEDSLIAQDIYTGLLKDGYRVFFARVSLREVAGTEYEPYIYAALSSAKIMLAIGTKHDYYDAVWVKNEWSRFISMMSDDSEKVLIPCFRNMDAYDMPKEFKNMQALDMGEVTFFGSLMENIERILEKSKGKAIKETIVVNNDNTDVAPLLERGFMFLEDKEWDRADEFFEKVLNKDPKNAQAYLGKLLADLEVSSFEKLSEFHTTFSDSSNYEKIIRFGDNDLKESVKKCNDIIARRIEEARKKALYESALETMQTATTEEMFENAGYMFQEVKDYADAKEKSEECFLKAEDARKDKILSEAKGLMDTDIISCYESAIQILKEIPGWKDSDECIIESEKKIDDIKEKERAEKLERERKEEEDRLERERKKEIERKEEKRIAKRDTKIAIVITIFTCAFFAILFALVYVIVPNSKYNDAVSLMNEGKYGEAIIAFESLDGYKDSKDKIEECKEKQYNEAIELVDKGNIVEAYNIFQELGDYNDSEEKVANIRFTLNKEKLKNVTVGDYIFFGAIEQDNDTTNGYEEIEWLVLDIKDGKVLVISKYALVTRRFNNNSLNNVAWENCSLRKWLNEEFVNNKFSIDEQARITTVMVSSDNNSEYGTNSDNATQDKVFLLSITEANTYFSSDNERKCKPTRSARANSAFIGNGDNCWWWLRSPGVGQYCAATVNSDGTIDDYGEYIDNYGYGVRPAMWISIE